MHAFSVFCVCASGAGSIMESLDLGKQLIVVVNTALMDDHQQELAHAMQDKVSG